MTRRISYRPSWINDLTAPVIGERSSFCEKSGTSEPLGSRAPWGRPGGGPAPLPLMVRRGFDLAGLDWGRGARLQADAAQTRPAISRKGPPYSLFIHRYNVVPFNAAARGMFER